MRRKWRPILATVLVLSLAIFFYLHDAPPEFDLAGMTFPFDEDKPSLADIPADIRKLDGQMVAADGYLIPADTSDNIRRFALVTTLVRPAFGPPPVLKQILVGTAETPLSYNPDRLRVTGRLHVSLTYEDGFLVSLFHVDVDQVQTSPDDAPASWPWFVLLSAAAVIPTPFLVRTIKRRRLRSSGHCVQCGYDLRATPTRCPECGRQVTVSALPIPLTEFPSRLSDTNG